ncbi:MAG: hypothetical protein M3R17_03285 [Bacteroidota bacterium]|nr:hypothetical protein [Bacteroidota bacterium]
MSKKSIDRKALKKAVVFGRQDGKTDRQIYDELSLIYFDKKSIAQAINGTVTAEREKKYKVAQVVLLVLLAVTMVLKMLVVFGISLTSGKPALLIMVLIVPIMNLLFFVQIARYEAPAYRLCALLTLLSLVQSFRVTSETADIVITLILGGGIAGLSFYLSSVLFPGFRLNIEKGADGEYIQ